MARIFGGRRFLYSPNPALEMGMSHKHVKTVGVYSERQYLGHQTSSSLDCIQIRHASVYNDETSSKHTPVQSASRKGVAR